MNSLTKVELAVTASLMRNEADRWKQMAKATDSKRTAESYEANAHYFSNLYSKIRALESGSE